MLQWIKSQCFALQVQKMQLLKEKAFVYKFNRLKYCVEHSDSDLHKIIKRKNIAKSMFDKLANY